MVWDGYASPRNFSPGGWASGNTVQSGFDGYADPRNYQPGDWAGGSTVLFGFDGYSDPRTEARDEVFGWWLDRTAPYLDNQDPLPNATGVAIDKVVEFDLLDINNNIDLATVSIEVEGVLAYQGSTDTFAAPYNGGSSSRTLVDLGHHFAIQKTSDWDYFTTISVRVVAHDGYVDALDTTYSFRVIDYFVPELRNRFPASGASNVDIGTLISVDVIDEYSGIDLSTLDAYVSGADAYRVGLGFVSPYDGPLSSITPTTVDGYDGYHIVLDRTTVLPWGSTITPRITVDDFDGLHLDGSWSFDTSADAYAPQILREYPADGSTQPDTVRIAFDVLDEYGNIDGSATIVALDGYVIWQNDAPTDGYRGSRTAISSGNWDGYRYVMLPPADSTWPDAYLTVGVYAEDLSGNFVDGYCSFTSTPVSDGAHFIGYLTPAANNELWHWEEGSGLGRFPVVPPGFTFGGVHNFDYRNSSMDDIWIGMLTNSGSDRFSMIHWDGYSWTTYDATPSNNRGYCAISKVPGADYVFMCGDAIGSPNTYIYRWNGATFDVLQGQTNRGGRDWPLAISADECLFAVTWNTGAGAVRLRRWTTGGGFEVYSGGDLPTSVSMYNIIEFDGEAFLIDGNGDIWRGTWSGGFVKDNTTDGPFSVATVGDTRPCFAVSADDSFLCYAVGQDFWIRNGPDSWTNLGPTGVAGTTAQPAAVDSQTLWASGSNTSRISIDGGSTWNNLVSGGYAAQGFIAPISDPNRRIVTTYGTKVADYTLWTKGDSKYAAWCRWADNSSRGQDKADPDDLTVLATNYSDIQGFSSGEVVLSISSGGTGGSPADIAWHYDPTSDSWTAHKLSNPARIERLYGTDYVAERIHGVGEDGTNIYYFRWNGSAWTASLIPGSTGGYELNISASRDGQDIWITSSNSQLWHSDDGGTSWVNRFAAAAALHGSSKQLVISLSVVGTDKLYTLDGSLNLVEFSPQINTGTYDAVAGIWGDANSRLIMGARQAAGTTQKFLHLEGGVWVDKGPCNFTGGNKADRIHGYDYNNVYALSWNSDPVLKQWNGSTWVTDATLAPVGNLLFDVYVYGPNIEDVVVGGNQYIGFRDNSPRGAGVWTNQWAQLVADVAPTVVTGSYVGAIHAISANEIYVWLYYATSVSGGRLCKWDGVSWSYIGPFEWPYAGPARSSATAANKQWYSSGYGGAAGAQFFDGATVTRQDAVPFNLFGGDIWMFNDEVGYVAYSESGTFEFIVRRTADGASWSEIVRDSSWTGGSQNVYLGALTGPANLAKDVITTNEGAWVALQGLGGTMLFSKFEGGSWSVAAPDISEAAGDRSLFRDGSGDWWVFTADDLASDASVYELVTGSWSLQQKLGDTLTPTGISAFNDSAVMAVSAESNNRLWDDIAASGLGWLEGITGTNWLPTTQTWVGISKIGDADVTSPVLSNQNPAPDQTGVIIETNISLDITDDDSGLDAYSVILAIDGHTAWEMEMAQPGFSVGTFAIADGYRYVINPDADFSTYSYVVVEVDAYDFAGNYLDAYYSFLTIDTDPPEIANEFPPDGASGVNPNTLLSVDIFSKGIGVDFSTINAYVDGQLAYNGSFIAPFNGVSSDITPTVVDGYDAYNLIIDKTAPYHSGDSVTTRIDALNKDGY